MTEQTQIPERHQQFADTIRPSVVAAVAHKTGVYVWTGKGGFGFGYFPEEAAEEPEPGALETIGNLHAYYDFYIADMFTMDAIPDDHRHYREDASIFVNIVLKGVPRSEH